MNEDEEPVAALKREVMEETKLVVTHAELVFIEEHAAPYNDQYIYLCEVESYDAVELHSLSEEAALNKYGMNTHAPMWVGINGFKNLSFRTPALQQAILNGLKKGFPSSPVQL